MQPRKELLALISILAVATFFRFYQLDLIPPGLYHDEAINGNDAITALETGNYRAFYEDNYGREGLLINLSAVSFKLFGVSSWSLRLVPVLIGILTVLGLYLLARELFSWEIASISASFLAVSFWHVNFSRISFAGILVPFVMVYLLFFFWAGLKKLNKFYLAFAGVFLGLGFHTYIAFRVMPFVLVVTLLVYLWAIKNNVEHEHYVHTRYHIVQGIGIIFLVGALVAAPLVFYFFTNPDQLTERVGQVSVFNSKDIIGDVLRNTGKMLAMFNFRGDLNWRHNISGAPMLYWPIGALFAIGFFSSFIKLFRPIRTHGRISEIQAMLLSWFFVGLLPAILSNEGIPHALRTITVVPVVCIFAAEGLWWLYEKFPIAKKHALISGLVIAILILAFAFAEHNRYFNVWAKNPYTAAAFRQKHVQVAEKINSTQHTKRVYVVVKAGGVLVNGIPMPSQTVMFLTDTATPEKQKEKNIYYLTYEQFQKKQYNRPATLFFLE